MFAKFQTNPSAQTVTLEVIGTATGIFRFGGEDDDMSLETARNVSDLSNRVSGLLRKRQPMPDDIKEFLTYARDQLGSLALIPSAKRLNVIDIKTRQPWLEDSPKFRSGLEFFRQSMGWRAKEVYDNHFRDESQQIADKLPENLEGLDRESTAGRYGVAIGVGLQRVTPGGR